MSDFLDRRPVSWRREDADGSGSSPESGKDSDDAQFCQSLLSLVIIVLRG